MAIRPSADALPIGSSFSTTPHFADSPRSVKKTTTNVSTTATATPPYRIDVASSPRFADAPANASHPTSSTT